MADETTAMSDSMMMKGDYPIDVCIVSGEKLGSMGDPIVHDYEGREVKFCCKNCVATFEKEPAKYLEALDKAIVKKQGDNYPLSTCVVSGEKFGEMGKAVEIVYDNELVRLCCNGCKKDFAKDPDKYMKKIHDARQEQMMKGDKMIESEAGSQDGHSDHHH